MKRGDLVKLKSRLRDQYISVYDDQQILKLEAWIYLENYAPNLKVKRYQLNDEVAIVLGAKDIHKDGNGIDIIWNRFIKILFNSGIIGWVQKDVLTKIHEDD